jgi:hypothetical protein
MSEITLAISGEDLRASPLMPFVTRIADGSGDLYRRSAARGVGGEIGQTDGCPWHGGVLLMCWRSFCWSCGIEVCKPDGTF